MNDDLRERLSAEIHDRNGILRLDPAWVARDFLPAGRRMGLPEHDYDAGERGQISERWLASTTKADNTVGPENEGISDLRFADETRLSLVEVIAGAADLILGAEYASDHNGLGRLAKIFDFAARIPQHIHPPLEHAQRVGRNSKDEAYYFPPDVDMGVHPETFLGLHPSMTRDRAWNDLAREIEEWDDDDILRFSPAYLQVAEEGFFVPSGVLHAPGTALTLELQEDSDSMAMLQALNAGKIIDKHLLRKDLSAADLAEHGDAAVLNWIDWDVNTDPYFYENHRLVPVELRTEQGASEAWIFYGSPKFCGKRLIVDPGGRYVARERGAFSLLVWRGRGSIGGAEVAAGDFGNDELLIVHDRAIEDIEYVNEGDDPMVVIKIFGPDICVDAPGLPSWPVNP